LFFVVGCTGSLQQLKNLGYATFDNLIDNNYDQVVNNTARWCALRESIKQARRDLHSIYVCAHDQILHNQQLFLERKTERLNMLIEKIYDKSN
jgi:hypothetical protein